MVSNSSDLKRSPDQEDTDVNTEHSAKKQKTQLQADNKVSTEIQEKINNNNNNKDGNEDVINKDTEGKETGSKGTEDKVVEDKSGDKETNNETESKEAEDKELSKATENSEGKADDESNEKNDSTELADPSIDPEINNLDPLNDKNSVSEAVKNILSLNSEDLPKDDDSESISQKAIIKMKKLNHKEVERRRRETINNAIKELQDLVPTSHTNKAQIIKKASEYIRRLKDNEEALLSKWTLEKIITDQAINELSISNDKLKSELSKAYREIEQQKSHIKTFLSILSNQKNSKQVESYMEQLTTMLEEEDNEEEEEEQGEIEENSHSKEIEHSESNQESDSASKNLTNSETKSANLFESEDAPEENDDDKIPKDVENGNNDEAIPEKASTETSA